MIQHLHYIADIVQCIRSRLKPAQLIDMPSKRIIYLFFIETYKSKIKIY